MAQQNSHSNSESIFSEKKRVAFTRSILFRTARLSGIVSMLTIVVFALVIIPYQEDLLITRLASTAEVVATSIDQVVVTSIVVEDYSTVIEHCQKVVAERPSISFIVITRKDGFSLVNLADGWRHESLGGTWSAPQELVDGQEPSFKHSDLVQKEVFHYAYPLGYSGLDWGWIHVGLATDTFHNDLNEIYIRTLLLAIACIGIGVIVSILFSRGIVRPVLQLNNIAQRIGAGDLNTRAHITSGDEVELLANDFNAMTEALQKSYGESEDRVKERTLELSQANIQLRTEISERTQAEEARNQAETELEAQRTRMMHSDRLRSLGEMAAGIAHELNQPLVGVRGFAEHILIGQELKWELKPEALTERMNNIIEQADRMVHIIQHVRLFAREAGKPTTESVQINDTILSSLDMIGAQFNSHGIRLQTDLADQLPTITANPYSLEEVILNLLNNARDAIEVFKESAPTTYVPKVSIETNVSPENPNKVLIEISDNGGGISKDVVQKIFDPFFTTKDPDRGTGLGLSISKSIIEEFEGALSVTSENGQTHMKITLPINVI
ncbi:MAG: HAMP domain-containing protein [Candidatus Latescibacteria bacterium]|nr:HAMP domain-containing protein [Candidatus Latescibacterota bacterium]